MSLHAPEGPFGVHLHQPEHEVHLSDDVMVPPEQVDDHVLINQFFGLVHQAAPLPTDVCDDIDRLKAVLIHSEDAEQYTLLVDALSETSELIQRKRILEQKRSEALSQQENDVVAKILEEMMEYEKTIAERARQFLATKHEVTDIAIAAALGDVFTKLIPEVSEQDQAQLKMLASPYQMLGHYADPSQFLPFVQQPIGLSEIAQGHGEVLAELLHSTTMSDAEVQPAAVPDGVTQQVTVVDSNQVVIDPHQGQQERSQPVVAAVPVSMPVVEVQHPSPSPPVVPRVGGVKRKTPDTGPAMEEPESKTKKQKFIEADLSNIMKPFNATSNLKVKTLKIGSWFVETSETLEVCARLYHSKKQFVWMFLEPSTGANQKMQVNFADVDAILFNTIGDLHNICAITLQLNCPPKFFVESPDPKYKHNKCWVKCDDFTVGAQASTCLEHVLTLDKQLFSSRFGALSHYEKLMLGDPYLCSVARADPLFPPVGKDATVIGLRTWPQLRERFVTFLKVIDRYLLQDGPNAHISYINPHVLHKFKFRAADAPAEGSLGLNLDDTLALMKERGDYILSKDEIWYVVGMGKIGENALSLFRPNTNANADDAGEQAQLAALEQAAAAGADDADGLAPAPAKGRKPASKQKGAAAKGKAKFIRAACLICKERIPIVLGEGAPLFNVVLK